MLAFLVGLAVPYLVLFGWGERMSADGPRLDLSSAGGLLLVTVVIPIGAAWGVAELVNLASPRRLLDRRLGRATPARFCLGSVAGFLGAVGAAGLLPIVDRFVSDAAVMSISAAAACATCVLFLARVRREHCVFCGYDLRDGPGPGRPGAGLCPECGASAMAVR